MCAAFILPTAFVTMLLLSYQLCALAMCNSLHGRTWALMIVA